MHIYRNTDSQAAQKKNEYQVFHDYVSSEGQNWKHHQAVWGPPDFSEKM